MKKIVTMKVRKRFVIVLSGVLFITIVPLISLNLNRAILYQAKLNNSLALQCVTQTNKIKEGYYKKDKGKEIEEEKQRHKQRLKDRACAIYDCYVNWGEIYKTPWLNKKMLFEILTYQEKYQGIAKDYNWADFDAQAMMCLWINDQSGFCDRADYIDYHPKTKTRDYWIMQMNECHYKEKNKQCNLWRRVDKMFPELAKQADSSVEKNIAVWYLWLEDESKIHRQMSVWTMYTYSRSDSKTIYQRVATIK